MIQKQKLYLAYGSNLLRKQMQRRCPRCEYIGLARIKGWKFEYDGTCDDWSGMAVGNIIPSRDDDVIGAVYRLCADDIDRLDVFEDYPRDYLRKTVPATVLPSGERIDVFVYTRPEQAHGTPSVEYENTILSGAFEDHLPKAYVEKYLRYRR